MAAQVPCFCHSIILEVTTLPFHSIISISITSGGSGLSPQTSSSSRGIRGQSGLRWPKSTLVTGACRRRWITLDGDGRLSPLGTDQVYLLQDTTSWWKFRKFSGESLKSGRREGREKCVSAFQIKSEKMIVLLCLGLTGQLLKSNCPPAWSQFLIRYHDVIPKIIFDRSRLSQRRRWPDYRLKGGVHCWQRTSWEVASSPSHDAHVGPSAWAGDVVDVEDVKVVVFDVDVDVDVEDVVLDLLLVFLVCCWCFRYVVSSPFHARPALDPVHQLMVKSCFVVCKIKASRVMEMAVLMITVINKLF